MKLTSSMKATLLREIAEWEQFYRGTSLKPSGSERSAHADLSPLLQILLLRRAGESWYSIALELGQSDRYPIDLVDSFQDLELGRVILGSNKITFAEICEIIDWVFREEDAWAVDSGDKQTHEEEPSRTFRECLEQESWSVVEICAAIEQEHPGVKLDRFITDLPPWITGEYVPRARNRSRVDEIEVRESYIAALKLAATYHYPLSSAAFDSLVKLGVVESPGKQTIAKYFGSWKAACSVAGIDAWGKGEREYASTWSDSEMVDFVCACRKALSDFPTVAEYDAWARLNDGAPSGSTVRVRLGSWGTVNALVLERLRAKKT